MCIKESVTTRVPIRNKKDDQHVVPRTYLKHWRIAVDKNFVFGIDFSNKYKKGVQTFGLNDKVFKEKKFYNHQSFENSYFIEDVLGMEIEPTYDKIMSEVKSEINLSFDVRGKIIQWLCISKLRSPYMRSNTERVANFIYKTTESFRNKTLSSKKEEAIERHAKQVAKETQLNTFANEEQFHSLLTLYIETLNPKHWRILKSTPHFEFWTNDNPGFSPNTSVRSMEEMPFHPIMVLNAHSIIFYPLSPQYCLEITPFVRGTPLNTCAMNMEIKYEQAPHELIAFINKGIHYTCNKVLISNNREELDHWIFRIT